MNIVSSMALVVAVGWISGCATTSDSQITSVPLTATLYNPGHMAQATLAPMGNQTDIRLFIGGVPLGSGSPARLYTYVYTGSCSSLGPKPAYDLNQSVSSQFYSPESSALDSRGIHLRKSVPVAYETLRSGGYALVVRGSPADGGHDIFCGNLG
ncbi:hypothetical protein HFK74_11665|uniref:hypothetical protein n=1 Tax=Pseudomonas sp. SbOxS1 TaxID=2723884 RepID=UPI0015D25155|nr:hypothetical protein [Pseudomonas sp. SbOxS1]NYU03353.1 hypothetical protein [Pseudomonas sp. SbOxS1]